MPLLRAGLVVAAVAALGACAGTSLDGSMQPAAPMDEQVAVWAPAANAAPAARPAAPPLVGSWRWNDDVTIVRANGTGTYLRGGAVCYEFTYAIQGDVFTKLADRDHPCGVGRTFQFRFAVDATTLVLTHVRSGFQSRWTRLDNVPVGQTAAPPPAPEPAPPAAPAPAAGCTRDLDCKGDRICVDGRCQAP